MIPPDFKNRSGESSLVIDLLRHGAPVGGVKYRGKLDDPLAPEGWEAMWATTRDHGPWDHLFSSPLIRCAAFAHALGERVKLTPRIDPRLREMSFGDWEGRTSAELLAADGDRLTRFWRNPLENPPPGGDNLRDVHTRLQGFWHDTLNSHRPGERVLIIAHGGVIRVLLSLVLLTPLEHLSRITVPYAALARIRVDRIGDTWMPRLIFCGFTGA